MINIMGLSVGVGACLLILSFVLFEFSYDRFHSKAEQIYRVTSKSTNDYELRSIMSPPALGRELKQNYTEITRATRLILPWSGQGVTSTLGFYGEQQSSIKQNFHWGFYTDPDFFEMFDFPMIMGDADLALTRTNTIVLSESATEKLFGENWRDLDVLGQSLEYVNEFDRFYLEVTGVIADPPDNSHFQYDFLASFSTLSTGWGKDYADTWEGNQVYTYLEISPDTELQAIEDQIQHYVLKNAPVALGGQFEFGLQPMLDIHLNSSMENELKVNGELSRVYFLLALSMLILLLAIANYVNLSIAKSISRGSEVGIRKMLGARRPQLILQFLAESFILVLISLIIAILIVGVSSPFYSQLTGYQIELSATLWMILVGFTPVLALMSGVYPAFVLSGFDPFRLIKGRTARLARSFDLRKSLIVVQFTIAIVMVAFTGLMFLQVDFMKNSDPGFGKEGVLVLKGPTSRTETWIEHDQKPKTEVDEVDAFKDKVLHLADVEEASLSWSVPGGSNNLSGINLGPAYQNASLDLMIADNDYGKVYGIPVLAGAFSTDGGVVINQVAMEILGFDKPEKAIGAIFRDERNIEFRVNGVVSDYHHFGFKQKVSGLLFSKNDPGYKLDSFYSIKVKQENLERTIASVQNAYTSVYPSDSFDYFFMDSYFEAQFKNEKTFSGIFSAFALMAIFIACLGLFGLSMHSVLERSKEIGIRKVLGADLRNIVGLLSADFIKLILVAVIVSVPLAWFAMNKWLNGFAYRVEISWWIVPLAGIAVLIVALLTVASQSIKAALMNPVKSLKNE